jgi:hypothetical protein
MWISPAGWMRVADLATDPTGETVTKSDREIMEILESYDLTRCAHSAAQLAGCDAKTVRRYVALRDAGGGDPLLVRTALRPKLIDGFMAKVEELVDASKGKIRADKVHERLVAMGFTGTQRTTRRAVRQVKLAWRAGRRRSYRPWLAEPGLWLQFDWGDGPRVAGRKTQLFCAWLAWSRFRVVIPVYDPDDGLVDRLPGRDPAPGRGCAGVSAGRQREDGHRRTRRRGRGAASDDGRGGPALRDDSAVV